MTAAYDPNRPKTLAAMIHQVNEFLDLYDETLGRDPELGTVQQDLRLLAHWFRDHGFLAEQIYGSVFGPEPRCSTCDDQGWVAAHDPRCDGTCGAGCPIQADCPDPDCWLNSP